MNDLYEALALAAEFVEEEAENRSAAGAEYSDYEREARDLAERIRAALSAARPAVVSDGVVERMVATYALASWDGVPSSEAMRAALALLPGVEGEGSSRYLPSRTTQEPPSPTPCDLEGSND